MATAASDSSDDLRLELSLVEMGQRLALPTLSADRLLNRLCNVNYHLSKVDQKPGKSIQNALSGLMKALVAKHLFTHLNEDVKVAAASCICQLTRITAPNTPYDDDQMREVFELIVSSLKNMSCKSSRSYARKISILGHVAVLRLYLVMLDLDCEALIIEMFHHFADAARKYHPKNVFSDMEMIMTNVLKESENISVDLLFPILLIVKRDNKEVVPIARELVGRVLTSSASKLKPYLIQAVKSSGFSLCHYGEIVASICQETSGSVEQNDAAINDYKEENEIPKESGSTKQVDLANDISPKLVVSDVVMQSRQDESLADLNSLKKSKHCHLADETKNVNSSSVAEADDLGIEKVVNSEIKSDTKNILTKSDLGTIEPSENLYIYEKEVQTAPDHKKDNKDLPGSSDEDLFIDGTVSFQNLKGTGIRPANFESTNPSENLYVCMKEVETLPDHKNDSKDAPGPSHDLSISGALSWQNKIGIQPSLESTEPSENLNTYEKEVEDLLEHKKGGKDGPDSLRKDLSVDGAVSLRNDKETVIQSPSLKENEDDLTDLTSSIPSEAVPDAQLQRKDSTIKEATPVVDNAFGKACEGTSDSESRRNRCSEEKATAAISREDKTPPEIDETKKENATATASKARSLKPSLKKLGAISKKGDGLSSKQLELQKNRAQVKCVAEMNGTKSSTKNVDEPSVSIEYGGNAVGLKVEVCWPKDQIGQTSASLGKVRSVEPSSFHASVVHRSDGHPKKRKFAASRASAYEKRMCYNAVEKTWNTLDDMSSAFKFKTTQRESSNETMLYKKCLEELQNLEGLDDAEFAKAVNVLKDDKNAIAFTTIKGPRRLVWLRSLWQAS